MTASFPVPATVARLGWRRALALLTVALLCCGGPDVVAQNVRREYQIKAVFLFNFAQFTHWPAEAFADDQAPLVIGVLGTDPFGPMLKEAVSGEEMGLRPFVVQHYDRVEAVGACQILFISRSESNRLEQILGRLQHRPILTVGDMANFARRGGLIQLVTEKNHIRLRVNLTAVNATGLTLSSNLLRQAEITHSKQD